MILGNNYLEELTLDALLLIIDSNIDAVDILVCRSPRDN